MDNSDRSKSNLSFWQLISQCEIRIPQLQRDYAQGREGDSITQIRETLIDEFYEAILDDKQLILNFIYGDKKDEVFTPIDGQQRLTTLFLLHWYIFKRSKYVEGLNVLKKFSYLTRDTSKRFCERICETKVDFSMHCLDEQIMDCYWFSGNFYADPTIKSMLVVIETIHKKFGKCPDFQIIQEKLTSDECPIIFLWLSMDDFKNTDDLYIKMNARGKLLSDFEIFKAKLQNSTYMESILGESITDADKVLFISKYNNQFAELFYKFYQDQYDEAMMAFIMSYIRDDYFSHASESGVPQKDYRNDYKTIVNMNGNMFYRFIEAGGMGYEKVSNPIQVISSALVKCDKLLETFAKEEQLSVAQVINKKYYDESEIFKTNSLKATYEDSLVRYALYEYIYKFGYPKSDIQRESYNYWKRYVYNIVKNTEFGGRTEDICDAMVAFRKMVHSFNDETKKDVLTSIVAAKGSTAEIKHQQKEEQIKAKLMLNDVEWNNMILEAEEYFVDGQLGFILDFSKENDDVSKELFKINFDIAKKIFDGKKMLNSTLTSGLLERALLCMPDFSHNSTAHLLKQSNSTTTWGFYKKDYNKLLSNRDGGEKRNALKELFKKLDGCTEINQGLEEIISNTDVTLFNGKQAWKVPFIENNLFGISLGRFEFYNCIHLGKNNSEILLLAGTTVRSYSMELNTLLLAKKLRENNVKEPYMQLRMEKTGDIMDNSTNFPLRYIEYKGTKTAYMNDDKKQFLHMDNAGNVVNLSFEESFELLKNL